jgi:hypothetical protein
MPRSRDHEYVLACDLSLDSLDTAILTPNGDWTPHQAYTNNWTGFQALKQDLLIYLSHLDQARLTVTGESTGILWWHAFYHIATDPDFAPYEPALALLNPLHVKHFRKALPEDQKTDTDDPRLIGAYYHAAGVKNYTTFDPRYLPLRQLSRAYCRLIHTLAAEKAFALTLIYLIASEYCRIKPFSDTFGVTSTYILTECPDIAAIADIPLDALVNTLNTISKEHLKDAQDNARKLYQVAQDSYPLPDFLAPTVNTVFAMTLAHIRFLQRQQADYQRLIQTELDRLPEAQLALAYHGLGTVLVGGCLGEIQDTRRFTTGLRFDRQKNRWCERTYRDGQSGVARLAGLWWPRNSSGRFEGQDRHLARERNPYLRYWLIQAAHSLKGKQEEYAAYYQHKYKEVTRHQHKRALILTARKATRLIFALLHKGQMARLGEEAVT